MDKVKELQTAMIEANNFVKQLDESIRVPAFDRMLSKILQDRGNKGEQPPSAVKTTGDSLAKISKDSGIPVERLHEVYEEKDGCIEVVSTDIPFSSQAEQTKNIALLCVYGNKVASSQLRVPKKVINENLEHLGISHSAHRARDLKSTKGVKCIAGDILMLDSKGKENAISLLKEILDLR